MFSLFFIGFLTALLAVGGLSATTTRVKRDICPTTVGCIAPFPMLKEVITKDNVKGLYAASFGVVLDDLCSKKDTLDSCLDDTYCYDTTMRATGEGVQTVLRYICGDGREKLLSESTCFARDSFESGFKMCARALELETTVSSNMVAQGLLDTTTYCDAFNNYFKCVENMVESSCNADAAEFVVTMTAKVYEIFIRRSGCTFPY